MRAINHALTGGAIMATLSSPWALPLAFLSHFGLDALPHFDDKKRAPLGSRGFWAILAIDALLVAALLLALFNQTPPAWLVIAGVVLAVSPDIVHLNRLFKRRVFPEGPLYSLHKKIQWSETPAGLLVEGLWLLVMVKILF